MRRASTAHATDGLNSLLSLFADALLLSDGDPLSSILNGPTSVILSAQKIDSVRWLAQVTSSRQRSYPRQVRQVPSCERE